MVVIIPTNLVKLCILFGNAIPTSSLNFIYTCIIMYALVERLIAGQIFTNKLP